jgi:hypothetical protein
MFQIAGAILLAWFVIQVLSGRPIRWSNSDGWNYKKRKKESDEYNKDYDAYLMTLTPEQRKEIERLTWGGRHDYQEQQEKVYRDVQQWKQNQTYCTYCSAVMQAGDKFCTKCGRAKTN